MTLTASGLSVLLCTFNGGRYLREQLGSLERQDFECWRLYVSDDGSTDNTLEILQHWGKENSGRLISVRRGPGRGHAANFLALLNAEDVAGEYFAFADQDDIWDRDKLSRAVAALGVVARDRPALYCARTRSVSEAGEQIGESPLFTRAPSFANALLQNIGGGNTMVLNAAAREILRRGGAPDVVSHDWWSYLLVAGAGGIVLYDPAPCLSYRQHAENAIGANRGWRARWNRYRSFLTGRNRDWYSRNIEALHQCRELLTEANRKALASFERARDAGVIARLSALRTSGVYAQTASGQLGLYMATLIKKI